MNRGELVKKESKKIYLVIFAAFTAAGALVALDEILDIPHLILGTEVTPINWMEVGIESIFIFTAFLITLYILRYIFSEFETTLKKLEEAEREIANVWKRREGILDGITEPVITIAPNGDITYINEYALKLTGYTREEAMGAKCYTIFRPKGETCKGERCLILNMPDDVLSIKNIERTIIAKDGTEIEGVLSCARVKDENGNILGGMEIFRDVREERRKMRELEEREAELSIMNEELRTTNEELNESYLELKKKDEKLEELNAELVAKNNQLKLTQARIEHQRRTLESYSNLIAILNSEIDLDCLIKRTLDGVMEFTSSQLGILYLYDREKEVLKPHTAYGIRMEDTRELEIGEGFAGEAARKRRPVVVMEGFEDYRINTLNTAIPPRTILSIPVVYQNELLAVVELGSVNRIDEDLLTFAEDFALQFATALKNAMAYRRIETLVEELSLRNIEIEEANRKIQRADELKSEFLARVSHELRTPMTSILGFTKRVMKRAEGILPEKEIKQLEIVYRNAQELLKMINELLDLSKIESGQMELYIDEFNLKDVVDESIDLTFPLAEEKGLRIVKSLEDVEVTSDRGKIKEMLVNLIGNAIKFTDEGEVRVITQRQNEEYVQLIVEDTGVGIPEEDLERIFDEFRQVGCDGRRRHGTGLGLAITKKYAEMLGGGIEVESTVGKGTKFTIKLKKAIKEEGERE